MRKLEQYDIGHYFIHLPLDYATFGTCNALLRELGEVSIVQQSRHFNGDSVNGVGELSDPMTFEQLVTRVEAVLAEDIQAWQFGKQNVKKNWSANRCRGSLDLFETGEGARLQRLYYR